MNNAIEFVTFTLKNGESVPDFLIASKKMNDDFLTTQKGYISRKLLSKDDMWADIVLWETMEDALYAAEVCNENDSAVEYFSFIENVDLFYHFSVEQNY